MRWAMLVVTLGLLASRASAAEQAVGAELIRLHDDLHLSAAQESAWRDYTVAISPLRRRRVAAPLKP